MTSSHILKIVKKIVRAGAEVGLDEAGARFCGSIWPQIKKVVLPVIAELERRYPNLMLADLDGAKDAEAAARSLDEDTALQQALEDGFNALGLQQKDVLALLARNDEKLDRISTSIDRGYEDAGRRLDAIVNEIRKLGLRLDVAPVQVAAASLTISEIFEEASECQSDALNHANAGNIAGALRRIRQGREMTEAGLHRAPDDPQLLTALGFLEKTQAQVDANSDPDRAAAALSKAANCFAKVLEVRPHDANALNGMANVYIISHDYVRAMRLGEALFGAAPEYGAAVLDYAIAIEGRLEEAGNDPDLAQKLDTVYRRLRRLMEQPKQQFSAATLAYVRRRAGVAKRRLARLAASAGQAGPTGMPPHPQSSLSQR